MIKLKSERALIQIEQILKTAPSTNHSRTSAHHFLNTISEKDITLMENAIQEGCEQINPDDWK